MGNNGKFEKILDLKKLNIAHLFKFLSYLHAGKRDYPYNSFVGGEENAGNCERCIASSS